MKALRKLLVLLTFSIGAVLLVDGYDGPSVHTGEIPFSVHGRTMYLAQLDVDGILRDRRNGWLLLACSGAIFASFWFGRASSRAK